MTNTRKSIERFWMRTEVGYYTSVINIGVIKNIFDNLNGDPYFLFACSLTRTVIIRVASRRQERSKDDLRVENNALEVDAGIRCEFICTYR